MRPLKILLCTYGTRGDVEPFVALARGLQSAGCVVLLATSERFEPFVRSHDVPFFALSDASLAAIESDDGRAMLEGNSGLLKRITAGIRLARRSGSINAELMAEVWGAAQSFAPDSIVYHSKLFAAPHIAEKLGIPAFLGTLQPMIVPTKAFPAMGIAPLGLPGFNRLSYRLIYASFGLLRKSVNRFRKDMLNLRPIKTSRAVLFPPGAGEIPVLHAHGSALMSRPADWPDHAHITGYWRLPMPDDFVPPKELATFLEKGPAPVFVGFGSMPSMDSRALGRLVAEALREAGQRGVVSKGWAELEVDESDDVIAISPVPFRWLFPQMAAVVHHGGAGTTAEGLQAGAPTLICPFMGDQPGWARLCVDLGVAVPPIKRSQLTQQNLTKAICELTSNPTLRANAGLLATQLTEEDGVANAIDIILGQSDYVGQRAAHPDRC
ncbi:glycosyl transferase family 1 [Tateyamaria omphalii]|uniref:glycosyltransferase n=1 Tax=Tateyamaria omphalii TaxID=299262 RepID=UPI0016727088|nr:glycosyltransferase [Tateyamaria omphalii]GGX63602.1 glycosyl transferase family 1 [Tateyamaria omphalii]